MKMSSAKKDRVIVVGDHATAFGSTNDAAIAGIGGKAYTETEGLSYAGQGGEAQTGFAGVAVCAGGGGVAKGDGESLTFAYAGSHAAGGNGAVAWAHLHGNATTGHDGVAIASNGNATCDQRGTAIVRARYSSKTEWIAAAGPRGIAIGTNKDPDPKLHAKIRAVADSGGIAIAYDGHVVQGAATDTLLVIVRWHLAKDPLDVSRWIFKCGVVGRDTDASGAVLRAGTAYTLDKNDEFVTA